MDSGIIVVLIVIGFIVIYCMRVYNLDIKPAIQQRKQRAAEDYISYSGSALTLKVRSENIREFVTLEKEKDDYLGKTEKKVIYTSATVGGITTGGFDTVGGKTTVIRGGDTGKYKLTYSGGLINKIKLSNDLYAQAMNSPIKNYLDSKEKAIIVNLPFALPSYMLNGMSTMTIEQKQNLILSEGRKGFPDYEKATAIYNWLCGRD